MQKTDMKGDLLGQSEMAAAARIRARPELGRIVFSEHAVAGILGFFV